LKYFSTKNVLSVMDAVILILLMFIIWLNG